MSGSGDTNSMKPGPSGDYVFPTSRDEIEAFAMDFTDDLIATAERIVNDGAGMGDNVCDTKPQLDLQTKATNTCTLELTADVQQMKKDIAEKNKQLARLRHHVRVVQRADKLLLLTLCEGQQSFDLDGVKYSIDDLKKSLADFAIHEKVETKKYGHADMERFKYDQKYPAILEIPRGCESDDSASDSSWDEQSSTRSEIPHTIYSSRLYQPRPLIRSKSYPFLDAEMEDWMVMLGCTGWVGDGSDSDTEDDSDLSSESAGSMNSMSIIERFVDPFAEFGGERQRRMKLTRTFSLPDLTNVEMVFESSDSETDGEEKEDMVEEHLASDNCGIVLEPTSINA